MQVIQQRDALLRFTMGSSQVEIIFSMSKGEANNPEKGFRTLAKRLRRTWSVETNRDVFGTNILSRTKMIIFAGVTEKFSVSEITALHQFINVQKGHVVFLSGENGNREVTGNINFFLEKYGMSINSDAVIKSSFTKYLIPKEALITDAYLQKMTVPSSEKSSTEQDAIIFPFGATLKLRKPAIPLLTTGANCLPVHKPICGFYRSPATGRVLVITSVDVFHDSYIENEQNLTLVDRLFSLVFSENLPRVLPDEGDLQESEPYLDIAELANRVAPIANISFQLPSDLRKVYDSSFDMSDLAKIGKVVQAHMELGIARDPLSLVAPKFEGVYPSLQLAIYPPAFTDVLLPQLEFFDFNSEFESEREKLNQIFVGLGEKRDLKQYVLSVSSALHFDLPGASGSRSPKAIIEWIVSKTFALKCEGWLH